MSKTIKADQLGDALKDIIKEYSKEVQDVVNESIPDVAKDTVKELKRTSPKRPGGGAYAASWTSQIEKGRLGDEAIIYNKKHYQLTHLLEKGHAKVNGGRVNGIPHIKPAEDPAGENLGKIIEGKLT